MRAGAQPHHELQRNGRGALGREEKQHEGRRGTCLLRSFPGLEDDDPRPTIAGTRWNQESLATVRHAQAVLVVVTDPSPLCGHHAAEAAVAIRVGK